MSDLLQDLNSAQREAVTHEHGPLLIVAGAGTGKTTVLTRRYVWQLHEKKLKTNEIVALTFTEKAAEEMEDRVLQLLPNGTYDFWISTFHHFCQRVLEEYALEIGLPHRFRLLNETDAWLLLKRHLEELPLDHYRPLGNPVKFLASLLRHFSRAKDEGITPQEYAAFVQNVVLDGDSELVDGEKKRLQELAECYGVYQRILHEEGCLDFGDLIVETLRLLRERPAVLQTLRARIKLLLIDEFQDTNWAQYELVKLLAGDEKNLTVVGDDDQAIYKFRGASLANILQFRDDFPEAKTVLLTENYRSAQAILDVAYEFIKHNNPNRLETRLTDLGLSKQLVAQPRPDARIEGRWYVSLEDEARGVVQEILERKDGDPTLSWNEIAILARSNESAIPFIQALDRENIPFRFMALRGLYSKPLILDLLSFLHVCHGSHESTFVWRVLSMDLYRFTPAEIALFLQQSARKGISLWKSVHQAQLIPDIQEETLAKARTLVADVEGIAVLTRRETPLKIFHTTLQRTGLLSHILHQEENLKRDTLALLQAFTDRVKRYETVTHDPTLRGLLEELQLEIDSGEEGALQSDPDAGPEMVKVMTIHAAKGLEFRQVFVVSMVDQRFPTRERGEAIPLPDGLVKERIPEGDTHLEEERRLFYVAITRAKESVICTGASAYGGTRKKKPSVFFAEAGIEPVEQKSSMIFGDQTTSESRAEDPERQAFPLKRRFSFTQLAAFRNCPLQYKFAHVYRIPILGSYQKSFGQSIHLSLHDILKTHLERGRTQQVSLFAAPTPAFQGLRVTKDEALTLFEQRWIDEWYPNRRTHDEYQQEGRAAIARLWDEWSHTPPPVLHLELPFDWRLGQHSVKGSVDRIDEQADGSVALYDYKTGQGKTDDMLSAEDKEQLHLYQLAMEDRGMQVSKLAYVYVRSGQIASVDVLQGKAREDFLETLEERMDAILSSQFPAQPSSMKCRFCDFREVCDFRKL